MSSAAPDNVQIDLNADLGEEVTDDVALLALVSSANVACGYHAGNRSIMQAVCAEAARRGVSVGAQVSYDDREHFGRRALDVAEPTLREQVADQVGVLSAIASAEGIAVRYVKPHGALYHRVLDDEAQARAVLDGSGDLPVLGMRPGHLLEGAQARGRRTFDEAFPDRGYTEAGRLLDRDRPGALVHGAEAVSANALAFALSGRAHSLCLHGDSPGAVETARQVRDTLLAAGFRLAGL